MACCNNNEVFESLAQPRRRPLKHHERHSITGHRIVIFNPIRILVNALVVKMRVVTTFFLLQSVSIDPSIYRSVANNKSCYKMTKTTKQKDIPRQKIGEDISRLHSTLCTSGNWDLNPDSFRLEEGLEERLPLDVVEWNAKTRRYQVPKGHSVTIDDVIVQAMVAVLLYRMEKGWGRERFFQALSVWTGPDKGVDDDDDDDFTQTFPLENHWQEDIDLFIREKKLGKTTLSHSDSFCNFAQLYKCSRGKRKRRSEYILSQCHVLAEQAAVQMALHLQNENSREYSTLAALMVKFAIQDDETIMRDLANSVVQSARKESNCFPKVAFNDLDDLESERAHKKQRV